MSAMYALNAASEQHNRRGVSENMDNNREKTMNAKLKALEAAINNRQPIRGIDDATLLEAAYALYAAVQSMPDLKAAAVHLLPYTEKQKPLKLSQPRV